MLRRVWRKIVDSLAVCFTNYFKKKHMLNKTSHEKVLGVQLKKDLSRSKRPSDGLNQVLSTFQ